MHLVPQVGPQADISGHHLSEQLIVPVRHRRELDVSAGLDDGLSGRVEHDSAIVTIAHPKLLAKDHKSTVVTVAKEHA